MAPEGRVRTTTIGDLFEFAFVYMGKVFNKNRFKIRKDWFDIALKHLSMMKTVVNLMQISKKYRWQIKVGEIQSKGLRGVNYTKYEPPSVQNMLEKCTRDFVEKRQNTCFWAKIYYNFTQASLEE
jgi:hypothetical protein